MKHAAMKSKVIIVMPAYNAAETRERTYRDIPQGSFDEIILVEDNSKDNTAESPDHSASTPSSIRTTGVRRESENLL